MSEVQEKGLKVGGHQFRRFEGADSAWGARRSDYPAWEDIPKEFRSGNTPFNEAFSKLFFRGGKLADFGLSWKKDIDQTQAMAALRNLAETGVVDWSVGAPAAS